MNEKNNILSKFESLKNKNPYKVPEDYFDTLLSRIQKKVETSEKRTGIAWNLSFRPLMKLSFLIIGIVFIAFISYNTLRPFWSSKNDQIDEIALYLDSQIYSFDDLTLSSAAEMNKDESKMKTNEQNDTINYLINNNIGFDEIINEL